MSREHFATNQRVREFWEEEACGERTATGETTADALAAQAKAKYAAEPYIPAFARFHEAADKRVLEIGVGMGADHERFAAARPQLLAGVDITQKAVVTTRQRLLEFGLESRLQVADALDLPFADSEFDLVYSWGVLHHSASTERAIEEVWRVLRPGGTARVMLYHRYGIGFRLVWLRHSILAGKPLRSFDDVLTHEVESFGTRAFSRADAVSLFHQFKNVEVESILTMGDLLEGSIGRRHGGTLLQVVKALWPRALVRSLGPRWGSDLLIEARK